MTDCNATLTTATVKPCPFETPCIGDHCVSGLHVGALHTLTCERHDEDAFAPHYAQGASWHDGTLGATPHTPALHEQIEEYAKHNDYAATRAERHVQHYRSCGCLGDSAECCDPKCCPPADEGYQPGHGSHCCTPTPPADVCPSCGGTGSTCGDETCSHHGCECPCGGTGEVQWDYDDHEAGATVKASAPCPNCEGRGHEKYDASHKSWMHREFGPTDCPSCGGTGEVDHEAVRP